MAVIRSTNNIEIVSLDKPCMLAQMIADFCLKQVLSTHTYRYADGEMRVILEQPELVKDKHIILVQSTYPPVHDHMLRVAFLMHELKNAGARYVTGVLPYFGYSRQEKSDINEKPGPAAVIAKLYEGAGLDELLTVDIHSQRICDFFSVPFSNVSLDNLIAQHIRQNLAPSAGTCLVAPDKGAEERIQRIADQTNLDFLVFVKERFGPDKTRVVSKVGTCTGHTAIIIDDIIDTGGTALNVCNELISAGFKYIYGYFIHPVFSGDAIEKVAASAFTKVFVSNSIPLKQSISKIEVLDIANILLETLKINV